MSELNYEKTYWNKEIADILGIGDSTLRKWCIELEKNGYEFLKDKQGNRAFTDHDAIAIRKFKELVQTRQMTLENAANVVVSTFSRNVESEGTTPVLPQNERSDLVLSEFKEQLLNEFRNIIREEIRQELAATIQLQDDRQKRITDRITEKRVEVRLEEEAFSLWAAKPESERLKKTGWFRKEEDDEKRNRFVRQYVNQNFEERLKLEYGLE